MSVDEMLLNACCTWGWRYWKRSFFAVCILKRYKKLQVPLIDFCLEFLTEGTTGSRKMFSFFKDLITQTDFSQYLSAWNFTFISSFFFFYKLSHISHKYLCTKHNSFTRFRFWRTIIQSGRWLVNRTEWNVWVKSVKPSTKMQHQLS